MKLNCGQDMDRATSNWTLIGQVSVGFGLGSNSRFNLRYDETHLQVDLVYSQFGCDAHHCRQVKNMVSSL
jgi:hypothetical protein